MDPRAFCRDRAAQPGSTMYYATLFLPPEDQELPVAAEALRLELFEIVHHASDRSVAQQRLAWWSTELVATRDGDPSHPITRALASKVDAAEWRRPEWVSILGRLGSLARAGNPGSRTDRDDLCRALGACIDVVDRAASPARTGSAPAEAGYWLVRSELARNPVAPAPAGLHYLPREVLEELALADVRTPDLQGSPAVAEWLASERATCIAALDELDRLAGQRPAPVTTCSRARARIEAAMLRTAMSRGPSSAGTRPRRAATRPCSPGCAASPRTA